MNGPPTPPRRQFYQSDRAERDRIVKHLKQKPPPERPLDYGHQSPRLMGEILEGMQAEHAQDVHDAAALFDATPTERNTDG